MTEKLKPCPFCGGEAKLNTMGAMCENDLCGALIPGYGTTAVFSTIKGWNKRVNAEMLKRIGGSDGS